MDGIKLMEYGNIPRNCEQCGGIMVYKGVGEYQCEDCGALEYDDYGKVRLYIEKHEGATAAEIEAAVGVTQRSIRQLLREARIQVAAGSKTFLHCEVCGADIRSGRFCPECEMKLHRNIEAEQRERLRKNAKGYGKGQGGDDGQKRFVRDR